MPDLNYLDKIPGYLREDMTRRGICLMDIIAYESFDLMPDDSFSDCWFMFDKNQWYVFYGREQVRTSGKLHHPVVGYTLTGFDFGDISGVERLEVERFVSTARLVAHYADKSVPDKELCRFSIGISGRFDHLTRRFDAFRRGEEFSEKADDDRELYCPKCGRRYPDPDRKICPKCVDRKSVFRRLMGFFFVYGKKLALFFLTLVLGTVFGVVSPYFGTKLLYDNVLTPGVDDTLYGKVGLVMLIIICARLLQLGLEMLQNYVVAGVVPWVVNDLKVKIFSAMQRLSVGFYTGKQTGQLISRVNNDSNNIYWFFVDGVPGVVMDAATFIGATVIMFVMNWKLALIAVSVTPIIVSAYKVLRRKFRKMHYTAWVNSSRMNSHISETMTGQRIIKAFATEQEEDRRFSDYSNATRVTDLRVANTSGTWFPALSFATVVANMAVLCVGSIMIVRGVDGMTVGKLMTFIAYLSMLYGPLEFFAYISNWWSRCMDSAMRIFEVTDAESDVKEAENPVSMPEMRGNIDVKDVSFEYDAGHPVIRNLSLSVKAGQMVGIVGKTGAGKSTIVNLMARLYDVNSGSISIDGVDVRNIATADMRRNIGIVSQEIYLFIGSVADNIRYARPDATMEEVIASAKAAAAHEFIMALPDGYETRVGAGGQDLSGGQKQRISIARAIIQNPKILILDEATASMDTETERRIQQSISELKNGRTTIAIAHRLSTLRDADVLAVIDDGKMVEYGTHDELIKKKGEYAKLYKLQFDALKFIGFD